MSTQRGSSNTSSAKARRPNLSPYAQVAPPPLMSRSSRGAPSRTHVAVSGLPSSHGGAHPTVPPCYCPQCLAADKRRQALWHAPSPYLEDLTKSLVISQPARRKLQLVPTRRYPAAISPYETLREASRVSARAQLRAQLQVRTTAGASGADPAPAAPWAWACSSRPAHPDAHPDQTRTPGARVASPHSAPMAHRTPASLPCARLLMWRRRS